MLCLIPCLTFSCHRGHRGGKPQIGECSGFEARFEVDFQFAVFSWLFSRLAYLRSTLIYITPSLINFVIHHITIRF